MISHLWVSGHTRFLQRFVFCSAGTWVKIVGLFCLPALNSPTLGFPDNCEAFQDSLRNALLAAMWGNTCSITETTSHKQLIWGIDDSSASDSTKCRLVDVCMAPNRVCQALLTWPNRCLVKAVTPSSQWQHSVYRSGCTAMHTSSDCTTCHKALSQHGNGNMASTHMERYWMQDLVQQPGLPHTRKRHQEFQHCKISWSECIT